MSFQVAKGEIFGLLGPNGAGKTTTMEMIEGLHPPDARRDPGPRHGRPAARAGDQAPHRRPAPDRGALPAAHGRRAARACSAASTTAGQPVDRVLDDLELGEKRDAQTKTLSGGQQQRLSVALALVNDPEVVFLDEPTTGLDPAARQSLWSVIRRMQGEGRTILMTTHYMEEAEALCDRLAIMDHGRILDSGTVDELIGRRFQERGVRFGGPARPTEAPLAGAAPACQPRRRGGRRGRRCSRATCRRRSAALLELTDAAPARSPPNLMIRRASLEDVFLELTGRALRD